MYVPRAFEIGDQAEVRAIMRANGFARIVSAKDGELVASHLPFTFAEGGEHGRLLSHMARANSHWQQFDGSTEALVIFEGVHGYISPEWYGEGERAVPTWDYEAVHVYGKPVLIEDEERLLAMLHALVHTYEDRRATPWRSESQEESYLRGMAKGVVGFELEITRVEGKRKMGQNRPSVQAGVADALDASGARELAATIRRANGLVRDGD